MRNWIKVSAIGAMVCFAAVAPSAAQSPSGKGAATRLSQEQCGALWSRADSAKAGSLTEAQAQPYVTNFKAVDSDGDGKISRAEFLQGCDGGHVQSSAGTGAGSGTSGSGAPSGPNAPKM